MAINREALRKAAKKIYKEQVKGVPKKQRITFAQFFKQYKAQKSGKVDEINVINDDEEDFDFDGMINLDTLKDEENQ